ncbi:ANTAR domain-containing response regulator [Limimaricola cinnabarinus]|uniref:Response regulatory domain-containing protein n=1 Tax=Limimaricola cinnabarinus TaxID=1125964 RepID=A0A2G1MEG1_9RHOB|nr:hypothetical protein [Limimaricola cinnabarinus]PHP27087.1 hypothetical protein CJ301_13210 [Limimaricola cinnabarinus]
MADSLRIVLIEPDPERARLIIEALQETGSHRVQVLAGDAGLAAGIAAADPDLVLIDIADPSRDTLEELALASGPLERPVAMFVDRSNAPLTRAGLAPNAGPLP